MTVSLKEKGRRFGHTDRGAEAEIGILWLEGGRKESLPEPPQGAWSRQDLDFRLLAPRIV